MLRSFMTEGHMFLEPIWSFRLVRTLWTTEMWVFAAFEGPVPPETPFPFEDFSANQTGISSRKIVTPFSRHHKRTVTRWGSTSSTATNRSHFLKKMKNKKLKTKNSAHILTKRYLSDECFCITFMICGMIKTKCESTLEKTELHYRALMKGIAYTIHDVRTFSC